MQSEKTLSSRWKLFLLIIILSGVVLRMINLEAKLYWFNEVFTAMRVAGFDEHDDINPTLYTGEAVQAEDLLQFQEITDERSLVDTVRGFARKEPQQTPLYFITAKLAVRLTGDMVIGTRAVSVFFSILTLLVVFWLGWELFQEEGPAWIGAALTAVSPFFVRFAQEARPYSMWMFLVILSSIFFLRAVRKPSLLRWLLYSGSAILMFYTHILSILVLLGFGIYLLISQKTIYNAVIRGFVLASGAAFLAFLPWGAVMIYKRETVVNITGYLGESVPAELVQKLMLLNSARILAAWPESMNDTLLYLAVPILFLLLYAMYYLIRHTAARIWLFILLLASISLLFVTLQDLLFGGQRILHARYYFPTFAAFLLALAFLLSRKILQRSTLWSLITILILGVGLASSYVTIQDSTWWGLAQVDLDLLEIFKESPETMILTDSVYGVVAPLSYRLDPGVSFILVKRPFSFSLPEGSEPLYVYQPTEALAQHLITMPEVTLIPVYEGTRWEGSTYHLYELVRK